MTRRLVVLLIAMLAGLAAPVAAAQEAVAPIDQTSDAALAQDGAAYAVLASVDAAEGERRLRAQEASVAATDTLRELFRDRLAGIAIEQRPVFRIVVLLTGDVPIADRTITTDGGEVPVTFRTGAPATLDQLKAALTGHQAAIRAALPHPPGMGIDQRNGELVIVAAAADLAIEDRATMATRLAAIAGVPVRVRSIERPSVNEAEIEGGGRLVGSLPGDSQRYLCTAGFAVTDGARTGIATAAHCPDTLSYIDAAHREHPLAFVGQWGWGFQDVQINLADEPLAAAFYTDAARVLARPVEERRGVAGMRAGDVVCHRGERTGYSCGTVELTDFAPAGDLCGGACSPTWVTVGGADCRGGDSGSPVFVGTTAIGLLKGGSYRADGSCGFYFYMAVDYLPTGWRLLMAPRASIVIPDSIRDPAPSADASQQRDPGSSPG